MAFVEPSNKPTEQTLRQHYRMRLLVVLLIAFGLATFQLDFQSLWYDEGVTAIVIQRGAAWLTEWTANDIQPPLYYYVAAGWGALTGWSEWTLRFPSAWFATLGAALLAALALRLSRSCQAGMLAALLAALHPLLVYYSQEARMYAQLTTLATLTAYLLVRLADSHAPSRRAWLGFILTATAAVYTHYFAVFLLVGLAIAFVVDIRRQQSVEQATAKLRAFLLAGAAIVLLYTPWLGAIFSQLREDRSYWTGALKLHEALLKVAISFTSGETVFEQTALWLLVGYAALTVLAVANLLRGGSVSRRLLLYAGCWLLTPVIAVLVLAIAVPKFNARYVMESLPALLLIWAGGFAIRGEGRGARGDAPASQFTIRQIALRIDLLNRTAVLLFILGFSYAVAGWFFNPSFSKDHWRQITQFLRPRIAEDEAVILVSGHAWPVWQYYASDITPVRLPELEILDVDAVLDFQTTGETLRRAFSAESGLRGAWLVTWQDEVVDPNNVTPVQLELSGREKGQSATFHGLGLRRFAGFREHRFALAPPIDAPTDITFGDVVVLRGYKVVDNGDLLLFWERLPGATDDPPDLYMALSTTTEDETVVAAPPERRLAGYTYPFDRWQPGAIVTGYIPALHWLGAAEPTPGHYRFSVRVFDANDPAATPLPTTDGRTIVEFGPLEVSID
jgi:uncharacterized membrane protein